MRWMATPESYSPMRSVCPPPRLKAVRNDSRRVPDAVALKDHRLLGERVTASMSRRFELDVMAQRVTFGAGRVEHLPAELEALALRRVLLIATGSAKRDADDLADRYLNLFLRI